MKRIVIAILIVLHCSWLIAGGVGTTGANYLKIGLGAKATALGENFTALSDDASAAYWNAAGITALKKTRLDFMQLNWVAGISAKSFFGVYPLSENDYIGGYAFMLDTPQDKETKYADSPVIEYEETGNSFKSAVAVYNLSYARLLTEQISLGLGVKSISEDLAGTQAKGMGLDIGIIYRDLFPQTTFGASIQNIAGAKLRSDEDLPRIFSIGALYTTELWANRLNIVGDIKMPNDAAMRYGFGAEYWIANIVAARFGYNSFNSISLGMGVAFKDVYADYAYVPLGELGVTHRIAVGYAFDVTKPQAAAPIPQVIETPKTVEEVVEESFVTQDQAITTTVTVPTAKMVTPSVPVKTAPVVVTEDIFAETPNSVQAKPTPTLNVEQPAPTPAGEIDF